MKISGGGGAAPAGASSRAPSQTAASFEPAVHTTQEAAASLPTAAVKGLTSLDALLALQEAPGPLERRRRAVKRAGRLLDILDAVKLSLLEPGGISSLDQLKSAVDENRAQTDDPALEGVLDEIETRAAVELAKEEMNRLASVRAA